MSFVSFHIEPQKHCSIVSVFFAANGKSGTSNSHSFVGYFSSTSFILKFHSSAFRCGSFHLVVIIRKHNFNLNSVVLF